MVRDSNPNHKPIAERKELGGAEKERKKREVKNQEIKDAARAAKFFKKDHNLAPVTTESPGEPTNEAMEISIEETNEVNVIQDEVAPLPPSPIPEDADRTNQLDSSFIMDISDPSTWTMPLSQKQSRFLLASEPSQKQLLNYPRIQPGNKCFNPNYFRYEGDGTARKWLLYSESTNSLFCFSCCLFSNATKYPTSPWHRYGKGNAGFNDYLHQSRAIQMHEKSDQHFQSIMEWNSYMLALKTGKTLDLHCEEEIKKEISFWKQVLKGLFDAVLFLAKNNLPFRGTNENFGEHGCGNFLSLIELISQYYPPLALHLNRIQSGASSYTYLSPEIQNEFIEIAAANVKNEVLSIIRKRKYFSILLDATPDISHKEQVAFVIRTVDVSESGCQIEEHFLEFIHFDMKTGKQIAEMILERLARSKIDINYCRGQGYDNGANMAGKYNGVQAKIKEINQKAEFVPCAAHSLNLVGQNASTKVLEGKLMLGQIQYLYNFFAASPNRWSKLASRTKLTLKSQSLTRWSAKYEAVKVVTRQFENVAEALLDIMNSSDFNAQTIVEAQSVFDQMYNFKFLLGATVWCHILERIDICSKALQRNNVALDEAVLHLGGLLDWVKEFKQSGFELCNQSATKVANMLEIDCNSGFNARGTRGRLPARFRDEEVLPSSSQTPQEKFKVQFFDAVCSQIINEFSTRFKSMDSINKQFNFLWGNKLQSFSVVEARSSAALLSEMYPEDIKKEDFLQEIVYLKSAVSRFIEAEEVDLKEASAENVLNALVKHGQGHQFENVVKALTVFLVLPVSVATNERSFSKLKLIKNHLRSSMGQQRLSNLSILSIEHKLAKSLSVEKLIHDFATKKIRKIAI